MSPPLQIPVSNLPGCLPISGRGEELEQEGTIEEDLEPSSKSSRRSQVAHVKRGFLSLHFSILDLLLNLPTSHQFSPLCLPVCVPCSDAPLQPEVFSHIPQDIPLLPPSLLPSPSVLPSLHQLSHTTLMPSPRRHTHFPLLSWVRGLSHQSGISRSGTPGPFPLAVSLSRGIKRPSSPPMKRKSNSMTG